MSTSEKDFEAIGIDIEKTEDASHEALVTISEIFDRYKLNVIESTSILLHIVCGIASCTSEPKKVMQHFGDKMIAGAELIEEKLKQKKEETE